MACYSSSMCLKNHYCEPSTHLCHDCSDICDQDHSFSAWCSTFCPEVWRSQTDRTATTTTTTNTEEKGLYLSILLSISGLGFGFLLIIFVIFCKKCIHTWANNHQKGRNSPKPLYCGINITPDEAVDENCHGQKYTQCLTGDFSTEDERIKLDKENIDISVFRDIGDCVGSEKLSYRGDVVSHPTDEMANYCNTINDPQINQNRSDANLRAEIKQPPSKDSINSAGRSTSSDRESTVPKGFLEEIPGSNPMKHSVNICKSHDLGIADATPEGFLCNAEQVFLDMDQLSSSD